MIVLIDYDNIPDAVKRKGIVYIAEKIVGTVNAKNAKRVRMRLYGGWYEQLRLTKQAQDLGVTIESEFPRPMQLNIQGNPTSTIVNVELSRTIEAEPKHILYHTYRRRSNVEHLSCAPPAIYDCRDVECPMVQVHAFFNNEKCPRPQCYLSPEDFISKPTQKLVDGMMIVDLMYFAQLNYPEVTIVSSDDDLVPGMRMALLIGSHIHHVQTFVRQPSISYFEPSAQKNYSTYQL